MELKTKASFCLLFAELLIYFILRGVDFIFTMTEWDKEPTYEDVASNVHYWYLAFAYFSLFLSLLATYLFMKAFGTICRIELHVSDTITLVLMLLYTLVALGILTASGIIYPQIVSNHISFVVFYLLLTFIYYVDNHEQPKWLKVTNRIIVLSVLFNVVVGFTVGIVKEVTSTADSNVLTSMYLLYLLNNLLVIEYIDLGIRIMYPHHLVENYMIKFLRAQDTLREYKKRIEHFHTNEPLNLTGSYFEDKSDYETSVIIRRRFPVQNERDTFINNSLGNRGERIREVLRITDFGDEDQGDRMDNLINMYNAMIQITTVKKIHGVSLWCELFFICSFLFVLVVFFVTEVITLVIRYFIVHSEHTFTEVVTFQLCINILMWMVFTALLPFLFYARRQVTEYFYNEIDYRHFSVTFVLYWLALITLTIVGIVANLTEHGEVTADQISLDFTAYSFILATMIVFHVITKQLSRHPILYQFTAGLMWIILALVGTFVLLVVIQNFYNDADETIHPNENAWTYAHAVLEVLLLLQVLHLCCETKANLSRNGILEEQRLTATLVREQNKGAREHVN